MAVGKALTRVDARDKVTGRAKYTGDLEPRDYLVAKVVHSTIANGWVKSIDTTQAQAVPGVVKIVTCFDVPDIQYPTPAIPGAWRRPTRMWPTASCSTAGYASTGTTSPPW